MLYGYWTFTEQRGSQADETTITVPMPAELHRGALIGKQGVYVQKLEAKYDVRINFPDAKGGSDDASDRASSDGIVIRGSKKGAESAKKEIVELIAYEKEHGNTTRLQISSKALPRVLGRGGARIREIGEDTGAVIDVERGDGEASTSTVSLRLRGTKTAITAAEKVILEIVKEADDEVVIEIPVERSLHVSLIGKGGQNGMCFVSQLFLASRLTTKVAL
jgi:head-tail adaptor